MKAATVSPDFPSSCVNKTVNLRFSGQEVSFHLSHALFSSFDIDRGSRLLLKTLAPIMEASGPSRVLDWGCGVGVLGLALKKKHPASELWALDRDALAVRFAAENARRNKLVEGGFFLTAVGWEIWPYEQAWGGSGPAELAQGAYDLIVANLPAKAGAPVLEDFFLRAGTFLTPEGRVAAVIVHSLADWAEGVLVRHGLEILFKEDDREYRVFHFRGRVPVAENPWPAYHRSRPSINRGAWAYTLNTVWGLPGFDQVDFGADLVLDFIGHHPLQGQVLFCDPGQGHTPVFAARQAAGACDFTLASRDVLALKASAANLQAIAAEKRPGISCHPIATYADLGRLFSTEAFDWAFLQIHSDPKIPWELPLRDALLHVLKKNAFVLLAGTSTEIHRFLENHQGLAPWGIDRKSKGYRIVGLKKL